MSRLLQDCSSKVQERMDRFYTEYGPCCAGCDWWRHINSLVGECHKAAPVAGEQRFGMIGITSASLSLDAGHPMTPRDHHCGDFRDQFEWASAPANYLRRIGRDVPPEPLPTNEQVRDQDELFGVKHSENSNDQPRRI